MIRKIKTKQEVEKDQKKKNLVIGIILIVIMTFATAGYAFFSNSDNEEKKSYNGFKFVRQDGMWITVKDNLNYRFRYYPNEIKDVQISGSFKISDFNDKVLYFVNRDDYASYQILDNIYYKNTIVPRWQDACLDGINCTGDIPLKTCEDNLIVFVKNTNESLDTKVYRENNCIYITGDYVKGAETLLYKSLGII